MDEISPLKYLEGYQPSQEYIQKWGMGWEVKASSTFIDSLCRNPSLIGSYGYSYAVKIQNRGLVGARSWSRALRLVGAGNGQNAAHRLKDKPKRTWSP